MATVETPAQTVKRRASDYLPGIQAAKAAVMLEGQRRAQNDYHNRVADGHKLGETLLRMAGVKHTDDEGAPEDEEMGGIVITGDITNTITQPGKETEKTALDTARQAGGGLLKTALPLLLAAAAGPIGGVVGYMLANRPQVQAVSNEGAAKVRVYWGDTEIKPGQSLDGTVNINESTK